MTNGFWILPAALIAAFIFISTACQIQTKPIAEQELTRLE